MSEQTTYEPNADPTPEAEPDVTEDDGGATEDDAPEDGTAEAQAKPKSPVGLTLTGDGLTLKPIKYPMPLKAPRFELMINGSPRVAAQTTFRDIRYTYFEYEGASFYVPGHLSDEPEYTLTFSEGYVFTPAKLDRKQQAAAAAASKKAKGGAAAETSAPGIAAEGPGTGPAASESASEGGRSPAPVETSAAASAAPAEPKRKAKR
jgi:hypothetical protein